MVCKIIEMKAIWQDLQVKTDFLEFKLYFLAKKMAQARGLSHDIAHKMLKFG